MPGRCSHLWEEGLVTSLVPEKAIPLHTLSFCVHVSLLWSDMFEFQNSPSDHVFAVSSVMFHRGLDSACLKSHSSPLPHHTPGPALSQETVPPVWVPLTVHQVTSQPSLQHTLSPLCHGHPPTLTPQRLRWPSPTQRRQLLTGLSV